MDSIYFEKDFLLEIVHEDDHIVVINKPPNILTHLTKISEDTISVLDILNRQLTRKMFPIHRLDRATTGILIFAKDAITAEKINEPFRLKKVKKTYHAIVRGYMEKTGFIDEPLFSETKGVYQEAVSEWQSLEASEMLWEVSRYPTSRYSLIALFPQTGRHHQLRKHMAKLRHPIIGDRRHGDVKHNNFWRDKFGTNRLWLHASKIEIPFDGDTLKFEAGLPEDFQQIITALGLNKTIN